MHGAFRALRGLIGEPSRAVAVERMAVALSLTLESRFST